MRAKIFKIELPKNYRAEEGWFEFASKAAQLEVPDFKPSEAKAKEISSQVDKKDEESKEKEEENQENQEKQEEMQNYEDEMDSLMKELNDLKKQLPKSTIQPKKDEDHLLNPEEFEKDEDANGHIDYIHTCANMRSSNYKLKPMEWLQMKLKAGRIVPALATTTAAIAGLQTIELVKILKKEKKENMKNAFLNLAVPILQLTEPGDAAKVKLHEDLSVNLWDRWEVKEGKKLSLKDLFEQLEDTYKLSPQDVFNGNKCNYSGMVMANKEKEKETIQAKNLIDLLEIEDDQKYVDLTVTFALVGDKEKQILKDTPPVRVYFIEKK